MMQQDDLQRMAAALNRSEQERRPITPLSAGDPSLKTVEDAYEVQMINVRRRLATGEPVIGKKVGLTSAAMRESMGVHEPDFGHLFAGMLRSELSPIAVGDFLQPRVESELAFVMGEDLQGPGVTLADVLRCTSGVMASFEIVASRIRDWKITLVDTIADNGSSAGLVLGDRLVPVSGLDLKHTGLVLEKNGCLLNTAAGASVMGHPALAVAWLANKLGSMGTALRKGEIVLSGSFTQAYDVKPGDVFCATFGGIGRVSAVFS